MGLCCLSWDGPVFDDQLHWEHDLAHDLGMRLGKLIALTEDGWRLMRRFRTELTIAADGVVSICGIEAPTAHEAMLRLADQIPCEMLGTSCITPPEEYRGPHVAPDNRFAETSLQTLLEPERASKEGKRLVELYRKRWERRLSHVQRRGIETLQSLIQREYTIAKGRRKEGKPRADLASESEPATAITCTQPAGKSKRSTARGDARLKIIAALTKHHRYAQGSLLNQEPMGVVELERVAGVSRSTASGFFTAEFKGHAAYKRTCRDKGRLIAALKLLNGEFSPSLLYGSDPEGTPEDD